MFNREALKAKDQTIEFLRDIIKTQKEIMDSLLKRLEHFMPVYTPSSGTETRPMVYDPSEKKYRTKTDEEIEQDMKALQGLGIL